jgi:tRNA modification GTPase
MTARDTIFALSSGHLPAGVAVVRLSGPGTGGAVEAIAGGLPPARRAVLRSFRDANGGVIDRGLVVWMPGPASFTGEDTAEFQLHGGRAVVAALARRLGSLPGLRPAEPGEFTRRAFETGRLDLTEVEGLADLIGAETEAQRRQALRQADGSLRRLYEDWRTRLVRIRAWIEAELDFVEEADVPEAAGARAFPEAAALAADIRRHLDDGGRGERLRRGLDVVIAGPPNAGKSSLLNALARRDAAIVAPEAGTTRDLIEVALDLGGYPVTLVDTAGLRETEAAVEQEGIRRARRRAGQADAVLWLSAPDAPGGEPPAFGEAVVLSVATKSDLGKVPGCDIGLSVATGEGLDRLVERLTALAEALCGAGEEPAISRERHRARLQAAVAALDAAVAEEGRPLELRAEWLRRASDELGQLTGAIGTEDLLGAIFAEFCVGK